MKRLVFGVSVMAFSLSVTAADDKGWRFLPGLDGDFEKAPTVSLMTGMMSPKDGDSGKILGVELSFNCPLLQPPTNKIRQQISYAQYDENGVKVSSIEINPHYVFEITPRLSIGGGPGFGYVSVDATGADANMFAMQLGGSVHFNVTEMFFLGADARYQMTENEDFGGTKGMDNWRMAMKAGISF